MMPISKNVDQLVMQLCTHAYLITRILGEFMASGIQTGGSQFDLTVAYLNFLSVRKAVKKEIKPFLSEAQHVTHISADSDLDRKIDSCLRLYHTYKVEKKQMQSLLATIIATSQQPEAEDRLGNLNQKFEKQTQRTKALFGTFSTTFVSLTKQQKVLNNESLKPSSSASSHVSSDLPLPNWPLFTGRNTLRYVEDAEPIETNAKVMNEMHEALLYINGHLQQMIDDSGTPGICSSLARYIADIKFFFVKSNIINMFNPPHKTSIESVKDWQYEKICHLLTSRIWNLPDAHLKQHQESLKRISVWSYYPTKAFLCLQQEILVAATKLHNFKREPTHQTSCSLGIQAELKKEIVTKLLSFPRCIQDALLNSLNKHLQLAALSQETLEKVVDENLPFLEKSLGDLQQTEADYVEYCPQDQYLKDAKFIIP
jgi:hypothetical protein